MSILVIIQLISVKNEIIEEMPYVFFLTKGYIIYDE